MPSLGKILDYFLSEKFNQAPENKRKGRTVVLLFLFIIIGTFIMWLSSFNIETTNNFPFGSAIVITLILLFIFRKTGSFHISGHLLGGLIFIFLFPVCLGTGGLYSDDTLWLLLGSILSFLGGNKWTGLIWSFITLSALGYLFYLENLSEESMIKDALIFDSKYYYFSISFLFFMILATIFIYENEKTKLIKALGTKRNELENSNRVLEKKVKERTHSLHSSNLQLQRSNADLEQFAYAASHDLQEPLRMVGNFVQLLEEEYAEKLDNDGKSYINFAVDGVTRMSSLIEDLLQYSRVGRKGLEVEYVDLNDILEEKLKNLKNLIDSKNATIRVDVLPKVRCIPRQLGIVFYNLIHNGIKFNNSDSPVVRVGYQDKGDEWLFEISDNGIGISQSYKEQIFELFKRLHAKEEYSGTGIGLSLCKKIIHHHKGDIYFESEENKGTTFYFNLPKKLVIENSTSE